MLSIWSSVPYSHRIDFQAQRPSPVLPTIRGSQPELNYISHATTVDLIEGKYDHLSVTFIDCRFQYEYEGGHIKVCDRLAQWD